MFATVASAKTPLKKTAYIALGDSLSFGYKDVTLKANAASNKANCEAGVVAAEKGEISKALTEKALCEPSYTFEPGFVGEFGKSLAKTEKAAGNELTTVNLGCPGETSDGLIGHNEAFGGGPSTEFNPCAYTNNLPSEGFPLKTEIGSSSELEAALALIQRKAEGAVTAVSLQIGSNDLLHVVSKCLSPTYDGEHGFTSLNQCLEHEVGPEGFAYSGGVFHHVLVNIGTTIGVLRGAGYTGKVLLLGFYNPNVLELPGSDALLKVLNEALEGQVASEGFGPNVKLAQPFNLINPEANLYTETESSKEHSKKVAKETKALCKYTEKCANHDIHPTAKGYAAIAKLMEAAF